MKPTNLKVVIVVVAVAIPSLFVTFFFRNDMRMAEWFYHPAWFSGYPWIRFNGVEPFPPQ